MRLVELVLVPKSFPSRYGFRCTLTLQRYLNGLWIVFVVFFGVAGVFSESQSRRVAGASRRWPFGCVFGGRR